jgi:lactate racemase
VRLRLPYGKDRIEVEVPDDAAVVDPTDPPAIADEQGAIAAALGEPASGPSLDDLVSGARRVAVVFPDITRPMPNRTVLPPLLAELEAAGAGPDRVDLLCATGTHRHATFAEMSALVGPEILSRYRVHDHSATDDDHVGVGRVEGTEVRIDRRYVESDLRIVTGFVEPHFFAGFSGGPKGVCPGLASLGTVLEAHSRRRISDPAATWTVMEGNPVHEFIAQATALAPPALSLDVTIDRERRLTGVFCGPLPGAHLSACRTVLETAVSQVPGPFEVVLSTNGGHPLDRSLYQAVKGMAAAERVVARGGTIVMAAECEDGVPSGGAFERLVDREYGNGGSIASGASAGSGGSGGSGGSAGSHGKGPAEPDGWQVQVLQRVLERAQVWLRAGGLDDASIRRARLRPVHDLGKAVEEALRENGQGSKLCVLVRGPLAVAGNTVAGNTPLLSTLEQPARDRRGRGRRSGGEHQG